MKSNAKNNGYMAAIAVLLVVAAIVWYNQLSSRATVPNAPGYVSGWFACKAHEGWLCKEDGEMKPNPDWKGPREADPRKAPPKRPPGPEQ